MLALEGGVCPVPIAGVLIREFEKIVRIPFASFLFSCVSQSRQEPCIGERGRQYLCPASMPAPLYIVIMNSRHKKTLAAVFRNPVFGTIDWTDIEALLMATGAEVVEVSGSRVRFVKGRFILYIYRPHPRKEASKYHVRDARAFLTEIGVTP